MDNRIKSMVAGVFLVSAIITNTSDERPLTIKERMALLKAAQVGDQQLVVNQRPVGRIQNETGYVSNRGAETIDFARNRSLQPVRVVVDKIVNDTDLETARDVVGHVRNRVRGMDVMEPEAAKRPSVRFLMNALDGISESEQLEILNTLQMELAMRAVAGMDEEEVAS